MTNPNPPLTAEERLSRLEGVYEHLATKADLARLEGDLARLEGDLKAEMADLKTEFKADLARLEGATKAEMADLKTEFKADLARLEGATKAEMADLKTDLSRDFMSQIKEVRKSLNQLQGGLAVLGFVLVLLQLWIKFSG